ncbi:MAG: tRNA epoxyqueuosine(34) reductase QueG [Aureliella sp.]
MADKNSPADVSAGKATTELRKKVAELGFTLCGVTAAAAPKRLEQFHQWLAAGHAGQMQYLETRRDAYASPESVLTGCKTIVMLALPYTTLADRQVPPDKRTAGRVARYAASPIDYHDLIHGRLKQLKRWLTEHFPESQSRGIVDTAPLNEREFAEAAGLGWIGKNTLLLNRSHGSYFFLAAMLTDIEFQVDAPDAKNYCGTCTACLDACPTNAFPQPFVLDATKCISYLTIEHRDTIHPELSLQMGDWMFGCDVCQEVCPWNRKAVETQEPSYREREPYRHADVLKVMAMTDEEFRMQYRKTPLWRSKRRGIIRNAILVAVNKRIHESLPILESLKNDEEQLIRDAASWATEQLSKGD